LVRRSGFTGRRNGFLASKDIAQFHFDFNFTQFLIGRPNTSGFAWEPVAVSSRQAFVL
jgi:hypothetical protein